MATYTDTGGGASGRKFSISRENGMVNKEGVPHFFEWIRELPQNAGKRKFETRRAKDGTDRHYELYRAIGGKLTGIRVETKTIENKPVDWLILDMQDGADDYLIEMGDFDGRYSMDIMKRLIDPRFDPNLTLRLSPYAMKDQNTGKWNIGLSAMCGVDTKLSATKTETATMHANPRLDGIPPADTREWKGKVEYDFSPVAAWLWQQVQALVIPRLQKDPVSSPASGSANTNIRPSDAANTMPGYTSPQSAPPPRQEPDASDGDDLPF
jgi:hypothetical protein